MSLSNQPSDFIYTPLHAGLPGLCASTDPCSSLADVSLSCSTDLNSGQSTYFEQVQEIIFVLFMYRCGLVNCVYSRVW